MTTPDPRARALAQQAAALLDAPPDSDLTALNACAVALDDACDALERQLGGRGARDPARAAALCAALEQLSTLRHRLRERVTALRFGALERIHDGLTRLRVRSSLSELLPHAAEELGRCCDFDRAVVSSVRGMSWRAEAVWIAPEHEPPAFGRLRERVLGSWRTLDGALPEAGVVRRRAAALVHAADHPQNHSPLAVLGSRAYVAAPVVATARVVGVLQADCDASGRALTTLDRDNIMSFADGFGLVFERAALLERLDRQRARVHAAFEAAERHLSGLDDTDTTLIRRDRDAVAVVRTAAGLRRAAISPVDQLLTARERQVVELMVQGARNSQIGDELVIAEETVKSHVRSIARKLRASSRAEAVSRYLQLRLREGA